MKFVSDSELASLYFLACVTGHCRGIVAVERFEALKN